MHHKPFDEGTRDKLELYREYLREWLPVFITDWNLAKPYGLTDQELDFIINYDTCQPAGRTMLGLLTGQSTTFVEMYEYYPDRMLTGVCGFVPTSFIDGGKVSVRGHTWGGSSGGIVNTAQMKAGRVTLARLSLHGECYRMHIVTGEGVKPRDWEELGWAPPAPYFPSLEIIPDGGVEAFADTALSQHYAVVYGDHRQRLVELCNLLDIDVI